MKSRIFNSRYLLFGALVIASLLTVYVGAESASSQASVCYGTSKSGRIDDAVKLPASGKNFTSYGTVPQLAGRTYVHNTVRDVVVASYRYMEDEQPGKVFKYAETGLAKGGKFRPHKTHQNGTSVDFMVPVIDRAGRSVHLSTNILNKYGYSIEFDKQGRYRDFIIDYEALAAHIVALDKAAREHNISISRVIFDPLLAPNLLSTRYGSYLREKIHIQKEQSWVRHDEHYHVDFAVKCNPL